MPNISSSPSWASIDQPAGGRVLIVVLLSCLLNLPLHSAAAEVDVTKLPPPAARTVDFAKDIKPILENSCLKCHGPEKPKGDLRLDSREAALKGGDNGKDILVGDSANSPLIHQVARLVKDSEMPPDGKGEPLTNEAIGQLRAWIDQGAKWPEGLVLNTPTVTSADKGKDPAQVADITRHVDFSKDIFPILQKSCFQCHGPDKQKALLRLDAKKVVFKGGTSGPAIIKEKGNDSLLFRKVAGLADGDQMPLKGPKLTAEQLGLIRAWIDQGAEWPDGLGSDASAVEKHWAYKKPVHPDSPKVKLTGWVRNSIDNFILARLEQENLKPSSEAARETLIRRLSLDLTGLPPTVEEVDEFLEDEKPGAYERLVERLLSSPHYGERWARPWLDQARYADTNGYEADSRRTIWPYRDWIIKAFNRDLPFDQFTIEQIAGDLLPNATLEQKIATGFHRNSMVNTEGGTDEEEFRTAAIVDRVNTTFDVWMGTTFNCSQCHTHKYDPFTQKEYYQVFALLNQTRDKGRSNDPEMEVPSPAHLAKRAELRTRIEPLEKTLNTQTPELDEAQAKWENQAQDFRHSIDAGWVTLESQLLKASGGVTLEKQSDQSILAGGATPDASVYEIAAATSAKPITAFRLEALNDDRLPQRGPGRNDNGNFVLTDFQVNAQAEAEVKRGPIAPPQLSNWKMIGPFSASSRSDAFSKEFPPEKEIDFTKSYADGKLTWQEKPEFADGKVHLLVGDNAATYLYRTITAPDAISLMVSLGSDDGIQVWLNAEKIHTKDVERGVTPDQDFVRLKLVQGENRLLMKINNGLSGYGFYFAVAADQSDAYRVKLDKAYADYSQDKFDVAGAIDGDAKSGWASGGEPINRVNRHAVFIASKPVEFTDAAHLTFRLKQEGEAKKHLLGKFRLSVSTASAEAQRGWAAIAAPARNILTVAAEQRTDAQKKELSAYYRSIAPSLDSVRQQIAELRKQEPKGIPTTLVLESVESPRPTHILMRGSHLNKGAEIGPGVPAALHPMPKGAPMDRLGFAEWLVSPENPLVGRVTMNRLWAQYFGRGLVETSEDFGAQGELPTHPGLLDWLATELIDQEWSLKAMHRLLVSSATYRQSSQISPELYQRDPFNRLLARGPRFRLEAEMVRDNALAISGLLSRKLGGPSVFPHQPDGVWASPYNSDQWKLSKDGDQFRRGLYTFWKRTAPYAAFMVFDAPSREVACERRPRTNTPLQALTTLNDPAFLATANALARRVLNDAGPDAKQRLSYAFKRCVARAPNEEETRHLLELYEATLQKYSHDLKSAEAMAMQGGLPKPEGECNLPELAAWTVISNVLLNLDETLTKG